MSEVDFGIAHSEHGGIAGEDFNLQRQMGVTVDGEPRLAEKRPLVAGPEHQIVRGTPGNSDRAIDAQVSRRSYGFEYLLGRFLRGLG